MRFRTSSKKSALLLLALSLTLVVSIRPGQADDRSKLLETAQNELKVDRATLVTLEKLQQLVAANTKDSQAHMMLGLYLDRQGLPDAAAEQFQLAVTYGPNNPDAIVKLVQSEVKAGHLQLALGILDAGRARFPDNAEMMYQAGVYFLDHNQLSYAASLLDQAYKMDRNIEGLPTALGRVYLLGNPARAAALATEDLVKKPDYEPAIRLRGIAYMNNGKFEKAVLDLQPAFDKARDSVPVSSSLAESYYWLGDYKKALRPSIYMIAFTSAYDIENSAPIEKLTRILTRLPKSYVEQVIAAESPDIDKKAHKPDYHYNLGRALDQVGMYQLAMNEYRQAIKMNDSYARAYFRLGRDQEVYEKNYTEALESYGKAHALRTWDSEIGLAYNRLSERLSNRSVDLSWQIKDWLSRIFN